MDPRYVSRNHKNRQEGRYGNSYNLFCKGAAIRTQSLRLFGNKLVDWAKQRQAEELRLKSEQKAPGGDFYNTAISRIDRYYANAVINAESRGDMAIAKAASMLGVTLKTYHKTVDKILEMA